MGQMKREFYHHELDNRPALEPVVLDKGALALTFHF